MFKKPIHTSGPIILDREKMNFMASFCIIRSDLPELEEKLKLLHPNEINYYKSLIHYKRKLSYLLGRVAGKKAISEIIGEDGELIFIDSGIFKFPVIKSTKNHNIQVSISHCDNIGIVIAFPEEHPLGVDIERIQDKNLEGIKNQLTIAELNLLTAAEIEFPIGSLIMWTAKEAISKIFKTGLTTEFKIFEIKSLIKRGSIYHSTFTNFLQYKAITFQSGDYVCSIVVPQNSIADLEQFADSFSVSTY